MSDDHGDVRTHGQRISTCVRERIETLVADLREARRKARLDHVDMAWLTGMTRQGVMYLEEGGSDPRLGSYLRCREAVRSRRPVADHYLDFLIARHRRALVAGRRAMGLTQEDLGARIGVRGPQVQKLEAGFAMPRLSSFLVVADALGLPVSFHTPTSSIVVLTPDGS